MKEILVKSNLIGKIIYITETTDDAVIHYVGKVTSQNNNIISIDKCNIFIIFNDINRKCYHYQQDCIINDIDKSTIYELTNNEYIETYINFINNDSKSKYDIHVNLIANES